MRMLTSARIILLVGALLLAFAGLTSSRGYPIAHGLEDFHFENLPDLIATSDLVVIGTVTDTARGPVFGQAPGTLQLRDITLHVREVLYGRYTDGTLTMLELGWGAEGSPLQLNDLGPTHVNDRGIHFLRQWDVGGVGPIWMLTNTQGRYRVQQDGSLEPGAHHDELSQELATRGEARLRSDILEAAHREDGRRHQSMELRRDS